MNEFPGCADSPTTLLDFDLFRQAQTPPLLPVPSSTSPCKAASQVCKVLTPEGGRRVSSISPSLASQKTAYPYTFSFPGFAAISLLGRRSTALANKMSLHVRSQSTSAHQMATNTSAQELCLLPENSMEPHSTAWQPAQPSLRTVSLGECSVFPLDSSVSEPGKQTFKRHGERVRVDDTTQEVEMVVYIVYRTESESQCGLSKC